MLFRLGITNINENERKLLEAEVECWILINELIELEISKKKHETRPFYNSRKDFYSQFLIAYKENNNLKPLSFIKNKLQEILNLKSYVPLSQYTLLTDIMTYDESLLIVNHIIKWLQKIYKYDEDMKVMPINFNKTLKSNIFNISTITNRLSDF